MGNSSSPWCDSSLCSILAIYISSLAQEISALCLFVQHPSPSPHNVLIMVLFCFWVFFFCNGKILLKTPGKLLWEQHPVREEKGGDIHNQFPRGRVVEGWHCHLPGYQGEEISLLPRATIPLARHGLTLLSAPALHRRTIPMSGQEL